MRPRSWESNFTYEKSQRLLRRSLHAEALGFVRFALLHYQNFVSGVALAQDDVLGWGLRWVHRLEAKTSFGGVRD